MPVEAVAPPPAEGGVSEKVRERSLFISIVDGSFHGGMVGFGENYVGAFAVFLGATAGQAAALGSWPPVAGAVFGALGVSVVDRLRHRKSTTVVGATVAGTVYLMLIAIAYSLTGSFAVYAVIAAWLLYHAANNVAQPPWNSWMGDLVPAERRGAYFGKRNGIIQLVTFVCLGIAGLGLDWFKEHERTLLGFAICLGIAAILKFISVGFLTRVAEPAYAPGTGDYFTFRQFLARSPNSNFAWFTFGIALMWFCVHLSGPFFTLYQLQTLEWSYRQYMLSIGVQTVALFAFQPWWGRLGDRRGSRFVILTSGVCCAILPTLWCFTRNFEILLAVQVFAGFCWGGFNLAVSNFLFEAVSPPKRARCAAYFSIVTSWGIAAGAAIGAWLVNHVTIRNSFLWSPFHFVFLLSGLLRLPVVLLWLRKVKDGEAAAVELRERARQLGVVVKGDPGDAV